ncbi:MAG TPA: GNAT family N-acetyltransferase [Caldilineaceae bacterium]|nr:GNAT family N-acetyltransferase [Caldilineaceae bacterium]
MTVQQHKVHIRPLQNDDHAEWLRLREALWPHQSPAQNAEEMSDILAAIDQMPVFVAERPDGGLCGFIEVAIHETAPGCRTAKIGYLEGWYVDPAWRRQGVGGALVQAAEHWAQTQGCREMASDTNGNYPDSPTAHARLGYEEVQRDIFFRKQLDDGATE